jgi:hypothetical protein
MWQCLCTFSSINIFVSLPFLMKSPDIIEIQVKQIQCKQTNCIKTLQKLAHVICLQEHWLFNFEQNLAEQITSNLKFKIKSVDDKNPIL